MGIDSLCRKYSKETSQVRGPSPGTREPVAMGNRFVMTRADDLALESRPQGPGGEGAPCPCAVFPAGMPFALLRVPALLLWGWRVLWTGRPADLRRLGQGRGCGV